MADMFAKDADVEWLTDWTNGNPFGEGDDDYLGAGGYLRYASGIECFVHARVGAAHVIVIDGTKGMYVTDKKIHAFYKTTEQPGPRCCRVCSKTPQNSSNLSESSRWRLRL